jgi:drug/metabolite transporter (DMT)-like permease
VKTTRLRSAALIALLAGAVGSVGLLLRAGHTSDQRMLLVLIAIWVLSPWVALAVADVVSKRWSPTTRTVLYYVMLVVTLGSLAMYVDDAAMPRRAQAAFVFVVVPLASWLLMVIVIPIAAFASRRLLRRGDKA